MKLLYITDNDIHGHGGGSIGSLKYYDAAKNYADMHKIELKVISLGQNISESLGIPVIKTNSIDRISRICGHSTFMYIVIKKHIDELKQYNPDIVLLGRSRLGFLAKILKNYNTNIKVITFFENIEFDYVDGYFAQLKGPKAIFYKLIEKMAVKRDESDAINYSDELVFLTERDANRARVLYSWTRKNFRIIPICLKENQPLHIKSIKKTIAFVGSLNYDSNLVALKNFIEHVWKPYLKNDSTFQFIIAGSKPKQYIYNWVKNFDNITVVADFDNLANILPVNTLMIAPIEKGKGAGMKVKVADTLSMGLMIAASDEALVGYEKAIEEDHLKGIMRCNTANEYVDAIRYYSSISDDMKIAIFRQNIAIFNKYYTFEVARSAISEIINKFFIVR